MINQVYRDATKDGFYNVGDILIVDVFGHVRRVVSTLTSWAAPAYRVEDGGELRPHRLTYPGPGRAALFGDFRLTRLIQPTINPTLGRSQMTNSIEGHKLALYAINDQGFYRGYTVPTLKALAKHRAKGQWDRNKALKSMFRVATDAAKNYHREHGSMFDKWSDVFPVEARHEAAAEMLDHYEELIWEQAADPSTLR